MEEGIISFIEFSIYIMKKLVFGKAKPPHISPYNVQYPIAISLLFPVVSTNLLYSFDSNIIKLLVYELEDFFC